MKLKSILKYKCINIKREREIEIDRLNKLISINSFIFSLFLVRVCLWISYSGFDCSHMQINTSICIFLFLIYFFFFDNY